MTESFLLRSVVILFLASFVAGCDGSGDGANSASESGTSVDQITLALNWYPESEHGGYIAADELGFFEKVGVEADIRPGGPGAPNLVIQELAAGTIDFAVSNADLVILARSKGVDIVALAAPLQASPRCILVHQDSGIERLADLKNVTLAISDSRPFALWMKHQLPLDNVTMVPFSGQVGEFLLNDNFAQQGYVFSEPFVVHEKGGSANVLMLSEIGFNPYASLLVTRRELIQNNPDLVRRTVEACVRGWREYLSSPDATNQRIHRDNSEMSLEALKFGADSMVKLCQAEGDAALCSMTSARWAELISQIEQVQEIEPGSVTAEECFDLSFLPSAEAQ